MVKRNFTRILFETKAVVDAGAVSLTGAVQNLGLGGMLFTAPSAETVELNTEVVVSIMIEGMSSITNIRLRGTVLRQNGETLAIRFNVDKIKLDSVLLLKTIILSNGGDEEKVEKEYNTILSRQEKQAQKS